MGRTFRALVALIALVGLVGFALIDRGGWAADVGYALVGLPSVLFVGWLARRAIRPRRAATAGDNAPA